MSGGFGGSTQGAERIPDFDPGDCFGEDLGKTGNLWTIENPRSSFLFQQPSIVTLMKSSGNHIADQDQCMYGLTFEDASATEFCKKPTRILGNFEGLSRLGITCDKSHTHTHAIGGYRSRSGWRKRSSEAAAYPPTLCRSWGKLVAEIFA